MTEQQRPPKPQDGKNYTWYEGAWREYEDVTPTWVQFLNFQIPNINATRRVPDLVRKELYKMASLADQRNEMVELFKTMKASLDTYGKHPIIDEAYNKIMNHE